MAAGDEYEMLTNLKNLRDQRKALRMQEQMAQSEIDKNNAAIMGAMNGGDDPANVQEWKYYNQLPSEDQKRFLDMKRAQQTLNLGGEQVTLDPITGGIGQRFPVTPKMSETPEYNADVEYAKQSAKNESDRVSSQIDKSNKAQSITDPLATAEALLPKASGGRVGATISGAKTFFGKSDAETKANEQLRLLSGWITSNVPRMEGPQSVADLENYKQMAADLGNINKPTGDRLAALQELRRLQQKYIIPNQQNYSGQRPQMSGVVDELNALTNNNPMATPPRNPNLNPDMPLGSQVNPQQPTESVIDWRDYRRANNKNAKR